MHKNTEIEKIFYNFNVLADELTDSPEVHKAHENAMDFLKQHKMPQEIELQVDDLLCRINYEGEKQGFIHGFQYAVKLLIGGDKN